MTSIIELSRTICPRLIKDLLLMLFSPTYRKHRQRITMICMQTQGRIASGPFMGMHYAKKAYGSQLIPQLAGTYELELRYVIADIQAYSYTTMVDIGAGEGYYAVGLARTLPSASVICFEQHRPSSQLLKNVAMANDVAGRLVILGRCDVDALSRVLTQHSKREARTLVICDVEGFESVLLDPVSVPALTKSDILVELHGEAIAAQIHLRFEPTHFISAIRSRPRVDSDWPSGLKMPGDDVVECMNEYRAPQEWFWMKAILCEKTDEPVDKIRPGKINI